MMTIKDAAKASGRTSGKAGKDDAAKNLGKADGEAGSDENQEDAFVSPEDPSKEKLEARVQALEDEDQRGKVGDARAHANGKAVGKAEAGAGSRTTIPKRVKPRQVTMTS